MAKTMNVKVLLDVKLDTAWQAIGTTVIPKGYVCVSTFTDSKALIKIGDGVSAWSSLPYLNEAEPVDLTDYYTKTETDSAISTAINEAIVGIFTIKGRVNTVNDLPTSDNKQGDVYLVGLSDAKEFAEYYWTGTFWDYMGTTTQVDLSNYYTKSEMDTALEGKSDTDHTHNYAGSTTAGGSANSAVKLDSSAGSETNPVYFKDGQPVAIAHSIQADVPADAQFTDTVYDDTELKQRVSTIEADYIKSTDKLILTCSLE